MKVEHAWWGRIKNGWGPRGSFARHHRLRGQAAIEFILILPLFLGFMFFLVDFGMLTYHYVSVANAVREGARYGAINCGDGDCATADVIARTLARSGGVLSDPLDVTVRWRDRGGNASNSDRGDSVVVSVNHTYSFLFVPGGSFPVVSCADMRLEQADGTLGLPDGTDC